MTRPLGTPSRRPGALEAPGPPTGRGRRRAALGAAGLVSLLGYAVGVPLVAGGGRIFQAYVLLFLGLFGVYLLAVLAVMRWPSGDRTAVTVILGFGLLFRLAVLPSPVFLSSDPYRYLWDGRVQVHGVNPYRHAPADAALNHLRDPAVYPSINRPGAFTVYPPGAEVVFALAAMLTGGGLLGWRLVVLGCEIATAALLIRLLRRRGQPVSRVLVYAWAPLAVFEGVQAGHLDFVMFPLLLLALSWREAGQSARAGVALGLAVLIKLYPAVLIPAWWRRGDRWFPAACLAVVAAGYAVYLPGVGSGVVGFLPRYFGSAEDFNVGLRLFLTDAAGWALGDRGRQALGGVVVRALHAVGYLDPRVPLGALLSAEEESALRAALNLPAGDVGQLVLLQVGNEAVRGMAMLLLFAVLGVVLLRIARRQPRGRRDVARAGLAAAAAYLLLVPTALHAWYAAWVLPFVTLHRGPAWLWFTGAVALSYLKYAWEPSGLPLWVRLVEFLPLYVLLVWEWRAGRWAVRSGAGSFTGRAS